MFLSRCARAKATHSCGGTYLVRPVRIGSGSKRCSGVCRLVLAQQRGRSARRTGARQRGGCRRPQPRSHAGPWIEFFLHCALPVLGYRGTVRDGSAFVICIIDISRFDNEPITAQSINCLCRSTRRVRLTSLRRDHHEIVSQITPILWPGSPICRICERYGRSTPARTGLHKIQQVSRFCTRRNASIAFHREARSKCSVRQSHWERSRDCYENKRTISDRHDETSGGQHFSPTGSIRQRFSCASRRPASGATAGDPARPATGHGKSATSLAMRKAGLPEAPWKQPVHRRPKLTEADLSHTHIPNLHWHNALQRAAVTTCRCRYQNNSATLRSAGQRK